MPDKTISTNDDLNFDEVEKTLGENIADIFEARNQLRNRCSSILKELNSKLNWEYGWEGRGPEVDDPDINCGEDSDIEALRSAFCNSTSCLYAFQYDKGKKYYANFGFLYSRDIMQGKCIFYTGIWNEKAEEDEYEAVAKKAKLGKLKTFYDSQVILFDPLIPLGEFTIDNARDTIFQLRTHWKNFQRKLHIQPKSTRRKKKIGTRK